MAAKFGSRWIDHLFYMFVKGINCMLDAEEIRCLQPLWRVIDVHFPMRDGNNRGFVFIHFLNAVDMRRVFRSSDELVINGMRCFVVAANWRRGSRLEMGVPMESRVRGREIGKGLQVLQICCVV